MSDGTTDGGRKGHPKSARIGKVVRRAIDGARQMMYPSAFRIKETPDLVTISESVIMRGRAQGDAERPASKGVDEDSKHLLQVIASVATAIWRMRMKLDGPAIAELPSELRHVPRHVQAAWDALAAGDIEVQDPTGQRYVPGMAVNPLTFQPMEGVGTEVIHETIKPSVFYKDTLIQRADVIVARPLDMKDMPMGPASDDHTVVGDDKPTESPMPDQSAQSGQDGHEVRPAE